MRQISERDLYPLGAAVMVILDAGGFTAILGDEPKRLTFAFRGLDGLAGETIYRLPIFEVPRTNLRRRVEYSRLNEILHYEREREQHMKNGRVSYLEYTMPWGTILTGELKFGPILKKGEPVFRSEVDQDIINELEQRAREAVDNG